MTGDYGYSARAFQAFLTNIVDADAIAVMPDAIAGAVDEANEGGCCLTCSADLGPKGAAAFAILTRAGGYEVPVARTVCGQCVRLHSRVELRLRARAAFHRGPGR